MALTRKFLTALGIESEKIDQIIEAHSDTVDGLKDEIKGLKEKAETLETVQKELDDAKKSLETKDAYKVKYDALKDEYDKYKSEVTAKAETDTKTNLYRALLKKAGVSDKRLDAIMKVLGNATADSKKEYKERFIIKFNDRIVPLQASDIAYIYSEEKNNYLVTAEGHKYIIDSSLDVMNEELDPSVFFRISRSCIVAMKAIRSILKQQGGRLRITADPEPSFEMTVSRSRVDDFMTWLEK